MFIALPTLNGLLLLAASATALGTALMNVGFATAIIAAILCSLTAASFLTAQFSLFGITLEREHAGDAPCGETLLLPLILRNRTFFYRMPMVITEKLPFCHGGKAAHLVPPMAPRETLRFTREVTAEKRGHFLLETCCLASGDPCGLFRRRKRFRLPSDVTIAPRIVPLTSVHIHHDHNLAVDQEGRPLGHAGTGSEFFGVRPYHPGDEMRSIHWKSSVAKGKLMVKEFEATATDRIVILLDSDKKDIGFDEIENNFEFLITAVASLTDYLSRKYCTLSFFTTSSGNTTLHENGDATGIRLKVMESLTDLLPSDTKIEILIADVMENIPENAVVYVFSMSFSEELSALIRLMDDQGFTVRWIYAPKQHFPHVEEDEPKRMTPVRLKWKKGEITPMTATYQSNLAELLKGENVLEEK